MSQKWNLQDIRPAGSRPTKKQRPTPPMESGEQESYTAPNSRVESARSRTQRAVSPKIRRNMLLAVILLVLFSGAGALASVLLSGAEVTVYPRHSEPTVNSEFTAHKNPGAGELGYEILTLEAEGERQVDASGSEPVSVQAEGTITIYKDTPRQERLIKNTRFESPNGLVFRISESAVVPGAAADGTPGSVTANVFADDVGEDYNLPANTRFTIPGFAENNFTELYEAMYAESNEAFSGGFDGEKFIIDNDILSRERESLQSELRTTLLERLENERPAGFALFSAAVTMTSQQLPSTAAGDSQATIKERATLRVPIFDETKFSNFLADATIPGYEGRPTRIDNFDALTFSYTSTTTQSRNISAVDSLSFSLAGSPHIVWTFDHEAFKSDLAGNAKTSLQSILGGYPALRKAEAAIQPFYKRTFPDDVTRITITEVIDK